MRGSEYIRGVFREVAKGSDPGVGPQEGAFLAAALEIMQELESPLKEETLVRLVVLDLEQRGVLGHRLRECA